jgi:DNA-binding LacI/PurR family transcriptional regulator
MRSVACAATVELKNKGFIITLELTKDLEALIAAHHAAERQLSGILALRTAINEDPSVAEILASIDIPVVAEGTDAVDFDKVMIDNKKAMEQAVEYLWSLGHRRIGLLKVDDSDKGDLPIRISNAVEELKKRDAFREDFICTVRDNVFGPLFDDPDMNGFLAREERPSALICMSDCLAVNMLVIAQRRGLRVPEDLSLIGFDNQDSGKFSQPALTSFENDYASLGVAAAKLLMERMENYSNRKRRLLLEQKFHIRNSCASPKS